MERVRLGIVGLGNMGSTHARAHAPKLRRAVLTAVCDIVPERMEPYEGVAKFDAAPQLIESGLIDAVLVATPHYSHTTIGAEVLERGLHLLVEKPISVHKADCERLIGAYERARARGAAPTFAAMFNQRTDPHYQAVRDLVRGGELGEIRRIDWVITNWFRSEAYYRSGGWRATWAGEGGGVLLNQCPHNLDVYTWIFGSPRRVRAICGFGKHHEIEVEDEVTAILEHDGGAVGVFVTTTGESPGVNRLEVVGDRGRVLYEGGRIVFERATTSVREFGRTTPELFANVPVWHCEIPASGHGGQHLEVLQDFVDAILDARPPLAPAEEGIRSVELANAMILSGLEDGAPIELPLDGAAYEARLRRLIAGSTHQKRVDERVAADMSASF